MRITLKKKGPTPAQRRRLIEGIAFIASHRSVWHQKNWVDIKDMASGCGTVGCLAGHIALTLNPHRPVVKIDPSILAKPYLARSHEEQKLAVNMAEYAEYVLATEADDPHAVSRFVRGKVVQIVHVRDRAARLIGMDSDELEDGLFRAQNSLDDIFFMAADEFGMTSEALKAECQRVIRDRGWIPQTKKAGRR